MGHTPLGKPHLIAVDTCVLMDLADHHPRGWAAVKALRAKYKGCQIVVLPTVLDELQFHSEGGGPPQKKRLSTHALKKMLDWEFQPVDFIPVQHGIIEENARHLLRKKVLPDTERNDALFLAEAGLYGCQIVLSNDAHIVNCDKELLRKVCLEQDLTELDIKHYGSR